MLTTTSGLIEKLKPFFTNEKGVLAAYLFGSFARGTQRPGSDLDIALLMDERSKALDRKTLSDYFLPVLGRLTRQDVHLIFLNEASYLVRREVFRDNLPIHVNDEVKLAHFKMVSLSLYLDFVPYFRRMEQKLKERFGMK